MAYLQIETQDGRQRVPLDRERLRIGRLSTNDVILPYHQISREHAELRRGDGTWWITDLGSTNGLQVNGRRVARYPLQPGERIQLAPGVSVWLMTTDDDVATLATTQMPTPGQVAYPSDSASLASEAPPVRFHFTLPDRFAAASEPKRDTTTPAGPSAAEYSESQSGAWLPADQATAWMGDSAPFEMSRSQAPHTQPKTTPQTGDLYRRSRARGTRKGDGSIPSSRRASTMGLYLCRTCGQRTPADALECQFCHSSIARPCHRCGLELIPSQEQCSRCQARNPEFTPSSR